MFTIVTTKVCSPKHIERHLVTSIRFVVDFVLSTFVDLSRLSLDERTRGELPGLDQFLNRTRAVYSILYTVASTIDYVIHPL